MSKYIIELDDRIKLVTSVGVTENGVVYTTSDYVHNLEELNSDYINEHYGELQNDAYQRGVEDGAKSVENWNNEEKKLRLDEAYQRGLDDAWEAARKIWQPDIYLRIFKVPMRMDCYTKFTASEAIEKLKAYEEKQNDKIVVGDEFVTCTGKRFVVLRVDENGEVDKYFDSEGRTYRMNVKYSSMKKTGRHFDIASILEDMRND